MNNRIKYPRTPHLPNSLGATCDDKVIQDLSIFEGKDVVVTIKMDGENTTLYHDYIHARSIDGKYHPSRDWVKAFHASIKHNIPLGDRICGENLYATHSIHYDNLNSYFYGFSYWNNRLCLDYDNTISIFNDMGISYPEELYRGLFDYKLIEKLANELQTDVNEGFVVRNIDSFHYDDFSNNVVKWVRANHVTSDDHWMYKTIIPNKLK